MKRIFDLRLVTCLLLAAALASILAAARTARGSAATGEPPLPGLPPVVEVFTGLGPAPTDVLPFDPRAQASVTRTYTNGHRTVWVSVARYTARNHPLTRPAVHLIAPERSAVSLTRDRVQFRAQDGGRAVTANLVTVHQLHRELAIVYWYLVDGEHVTSEYGLRWHLFVDTLMQRSPRVRLIRVATSPTDGLASILSSFYPVVTSTAN